MSSSIIPIMHCFDNKYCLPAAVSFYSMLEHANPKYTYKLYVLHTDISLQNQLKLKETMRGFENASLDFIDMGDQFVDLWCDVVPKYHYSKEIFYKFIPTSVFPQYDKIIVTDVDVVWKGDVSLSYCSLDVNENIYCAGVKAVGKILSFLQYYQDKFTDLELQAVQVCGGYYVYNLKKMREDSIEEKVLEFCKNNIERLQQPEQDCINISCYPYIKYLPLENVLCSYCYDLYKTEEDCIDDLQYTKEELEFAMLHPIQLHYATSIKPWTHPDCTKAEEWFKVLFKTPFGIDWLAMQKKPSPVVPPYRKKKIFKLSMPLGRWRRLSLELFKLKYAKND